MTTNLPISVFGALRCRVATLEAKAVPFVTPEATVLPAPIKTAKIAPRTRLA